MTSQPMDVDEDGDAKIARRIEEQAHHTAEGAAAAASDAEDTLHGVIAEAKGLRKMIMSGVVSTDDARRALVGLRRRHKEVAVHVPIHQDRVRRCREDHRRPGRQGRRAEEQVRKLPAVS